MPDYSYEAGKYFQKYHDKTMIHVQNTTVLPWFILSKVCFSLTCGNTMVLLIFTIILKLSIGCLYCTAKNVKNITAVLWYFLESYVFIYKRALWWYHGSFNIYHVTEMVYHSTTVVQVQNTTVVPWCISSNNVFPYKKSMIPWYFWYLPFHGKFTMVFMCYEVTHNILPRIP